MMISAILTAMTALIPAPNFYSWYSPETATACMEYAVQGVYAPHLDFDGDGILSTMDAVKIYKRYNMNLENGGSYVFDESGVMRIVEENVPAEKYNEYFYYEIDFIDGTPCRKYAYTATQITTAHVYCELNGSSFDFTVSIDPFKELVSVTD